MVQSSKTNTYGEEEGNLSEESLPTQLPPNNGTKGKEEKEREKRKKGNIKKKETSVALDRQLKGRALSFTTKNVSKQLY